MTRSEQSRQLLFSGLDGFVQAGRMSQQEADTFKIYARYLADDLVAEALEGKAIEVNAAAPQMAYPGPERRQGGRVPLAVRMKDDPQVVALLKESR